MNFVTHILDELRKPTNRFRKFDAPEIDQLCNNLEASVKFLLPKNGDTGVKLSQDIVPLLRMPYPIIAFEYSGNLTTDKIVTLAIEVAGSDGKIVDIYSIFCQHGYDWTVVPGKVTIDFDAIEVGKLTRQLSAGFPNMFAKVNAAWEKDCSNAFANHLNTMAREESRSVLKAIVCLNAKNVSTVTIHSPVKLNKRRKASGKAEFYEYKTLSIFLGDIAISARPKDRSRIAQHFFDGSPTMRLSAVRGHFKRRNGNLYWWSNHMRGSKKLGVIEKQYNLVHPNN